jgi:hypothetical protein
VPEGRKYEVLVDGDIGLILHKVCDLTQHTVPNKLFDYMSVGLPIVATKLKPVERILVTEQCGLSVDESPEQVAACLTMLIRDHEMRRQYSNNGYKGVRLNYLWNSEISTMQRSIFLLTARSS